MSWLISSSRTEPLNWPPFSASICSTSCSLRTSCSSSACRIAWRSASSESSGLILLPGPPVVVVKTRVEHLVGQRIHQTAEIDADETSKPRNFEYLINFISRCLQKRGLPSRKRIGYA